MKSTLCLCTRIFLIFLFLLLIPSGILSADSESDGFPNPDYKKTFSMGVSAPALLLTGPIIMAGYEGLGPVGFYGSFGYSDYGFSISELEDKSNSTIFGLGGGVAVKFYYNYKKKYHDSGYFAVQSYYSYMNAKDSSGNILKYHGLYGHFMYGWRWQWSLVFLDLSIGIGYGRYFKAEGTGVFNSDTKSKIDKYANRWYSGLLSSNLVVGIAF